MTAKELAEKIVQAVLDNVNWTFEDYDRGQAEKDVLDILSANQGKSSSEVLGA